MDDDERARQRLIDGYSRRAARYDLTSRLAPVPGYPQQAHRVRAIAELLVGPGSVVVDMACGTGLNFPLIERAIGPAGRLVGVDLSDAMLAQARRRVDAAGWGNVALVRSDAADYAFDGPVDAILATYPHALLPDPAGVVGRGTAALAPGGRWVVLDVKIPAMPSWARSVAAAVGGRSAGWLEWSRTRPWETVHRAMQAGLCDVAWTELFFGVAYLVAGTRGPAAV